MQSRFPLNHLEHFFYWDDHPGFPNTLLCRMRCRGKFDHAAAREAGRLLALRHPLIAAVIEESPSGRCQWNVSDQGPLIEFSSCESFDQPLRLRPFNLTREPGSRAVFRETADSTELWFMTHHACCDGLGGMQCVGDYLQLCDNLMRGRDAEHGLRKLDHSSLPTRGQLFKSAWEVFKHLVWEPIGVYGLSKFFWYKPVGLCNEGSDARQEPKPTEWIEPHCVTFALEKEETDRLFRHAEKRGSTANGVLARDLMTALWNWLETTGAQPSKRHPIRLFIPMNTRTIADRRLSACNHVSVVYLDRFPDMLKQRAATLGSINYEMKAIQNWKLSSTFRGILKVMQYRPKILRNMLAKPKCRATALFTNLGDFYQRLPLERVEGGVRVGDAVIEKIELMAPVRSLTPIAVSAFRFLDRQQVSLHYDPWQISEESVKQIGEHLQQALRRTLSAE